MAAPRITVRFSRPQMAKVLGPSIWLDDEAQAELGGTITVAGLAITAEAELLSFMADNAADAAAELLDAGMAATDSRLASWDAIDRRIRAALDAAGPAFIVEANDQLALFAA